MIPPVEPLFLPVGQRRLFALHHRPVGAVRGSVLHVSAFAEEMNKSRRMVVLQARALATAGWHVLQFDLTGTGDSEGDFGDATWDLWLDDVAAARAWLQVRCGHDPWIWGLRLGGLIAASALAQQPGPGLLLWQPVLSGRSHLQQFLRLKAGAAWLNAGQSGAADARAPLDRLGDGEAVEIAGYLLRPELVLPMAKCTFHWPVGVTRGLWFEVSPRADSVLAGGSLVAVRGAQEAGVDLEARVVQGSSFWQSLEIEESPALIAATTAGLCR